MPGARSAASGEELKKYLRTKLSHDEEQGASSPSAKMSQLTPKLQRLLGNIAESKKLELEKMGWTAIPHEVRSVDVQKIIRWECILMDNDTSNLISPDNNLLCVVRPTTFLITVLEVGASSVRFGVNILQ